MFTDFFNEYIVIYLNNSKYVFRLLFKVVIKSFSDTCKEIREFILLIKQLVDSQIILVSIPLKI